MSLTRRAATHVDQNPPLWYDLPGALKAIAVALNCSGGAAQSILREGCSTDVRGMGIPANGQPGGLHRLAHESYAHPVLPASGIVSPDTKFDRARLPPEKEWSQFPGRLPGLPQSSGNHVKLLPAHWQQCSIDDRGFLAQLDGFAAFDDVLIHADDLLAYLSGRASGTAIAKAVVLALPASGGGGHDRRRQIADALDSATADGQLKATDSAKTARRIVLERLGVDEGSVPSKGFSVRTIARIRGAGQKDKSPN